MGAVTIPSPHLTVHPSEVTVFPPLHSYPASTLHKLSQPSPLFVLPSSQYEATVLNFLPSPQISTQESAELVDPPDQVHPDSITHTLEHPSPEI